MLTGSALNKLQVHGYALVPSIDLEGAVGAACELGEITVDKRSPEPLRRISPQALSVANKNTLSSRYGEGRFPFHTDAAHWREPPEFVCLYCENPGAGKRSTELIDTNTWKIEHGLRVSLLSSIWKTGHVQPWLCTVGSEGGHTLKLRYDVGCMEPLGKDAVSTKAEIEQLINGSSKIAMHWACGSLLVFNNSRMLHARGSSTAPDSDRVLVRILVGGHQ